MWPLSSALLRRWDALVFKRKIERALALHLRGEGRSDGLTLNRQHARLELEWKAREIHPWDRAMSTGKRNTSFARQCLADVDAALGRLFEQLPHIDSIGMRVLDPYSNAVIIEGLVLRSNLQMPRPLSDRMWLAQIGLRFRLSNDRFEPLQLERGSDFQQTLAANPR